MDPQRAIYPQRVREKDGFLEFVGYQNMTKAWYCRGLTACAADPMACLENINSDMVLSIEEMAIQYLAARYN